MAQGKKHGGRVKGTPNIVGRSLKLRLEELLTSDFPRLKRELDALKGKDYVAAYTALARHVLPSDSTVTLQTSKTIEDILTSLCSPTSNTTTLDNDT